MSPPIWNAYNRYGGLLMSFETKAQAERYRDDRATLGIEVSIKRVWLNGRAA